MSTATAFTTAAKSPRELGLEMLTELHQLPSHCDYAKVRDLIARGASPDVYNDRGEWPLQACICYGHGEIGLLLAESGADANFKAPDSDNTSLMLAAHNGRVLIAGALLANGAQLEPQDDKGQTALQVAEWKVKTTQYSLDTFPGLNDCTNPDPRVVIVHYKAIEKLITEAAETRAAAARAETDRHAAAQAREQDWQNAGLPLRQPLTVSRHTIKLK